MGAHWLRNGPTMIRVVDRRTTTEPPEPRLVQVVIHRATDEDSPPNPVQA